MIRTLCELVRLPNGLTASSNVIAGYALARAQGAGPAPALQLLLVCLGAWALYGFGMALNDVMDRDKDLELHPQRPLPSGRLNPSAARVTLTALLLLGWTALLAAQPILLAPGVLLVLFIVLYDVILKPHPVRAGLAMGLCRALCILLGVSLAMASAGLQEWLLRPALFQLPAVYLLLITAVTGISTHEDDGIDSRGATFLATAIGAALLAVILAPAPQRWPALGVSLLLTGWVLSPLWRSPGRLGLLVRNAIFSLPLLDALWCLAWSQYSGALFCVTIWLSVQALARLLRQKEA